MSLLIHQIYYDAASKAALDPGFIPLDNSANARPDWREYWPIRRFLLEEVLDEDSFHGFLSPKFSEKTGLTSEQVARFVARCPPATDVVILTPHVGWDFNALFLNIFEQAEYFHPGLLPATEAALAAIGVPFKSDRLVSDLRTTVFSNFFVAKPRFWRPWLEINERLMALAEDPDNSVGRRLRTVTTYRPDAGPVELKVFVMERIATFLLARDETFRASRYPTEMVLADAPAEALACDALKLAMRARPDPHYLKAFAQVRETTLGRLRSTNRLPPK